MFTLYSHIVAIVFTEVIRRFIFSYSSIWAEETARYAFIYLVWLGASAAIGDRSHIRMTSYLNWFQIERRHICT